MALDLGMLTKQNPWWSDPGWWATDPHLVKLAEHPVRLPARIVDEIELEAAGLHTLRGPRQVGKSTDLKLLVERALASGYAPNQIIYLQLDLLYGQTVAALAATIDGAKRLARAGSGALVLLDEVTALDGWEIAVKALWDTGPLRGDVVVATGSSANDLYRGVAERWPGRRGAGVDHLVLPQGFAEFARAISPGLPESPRMRVGELLSPAGQQVLREALVHQAVLGDALDLYLRFGGLPEAVAEAASGRREPTPGTLRIVLDSIVREARRKGASEAAVHVLLERVARSLGSPVSWTAMAREMDVPLGSVRRGRGRGPSDKTVRDYVEFLAAGYFAMILYGWKSDLAGSDLARERKVYFGDPLLDRLSRARAGLPEDRPALVENTVALTLLRRYEPEDLLPAGFAEPTALHLWRSRRGGEIDFLCGSRSAVDVVEVKFQERVDRRVLRGPKAAFPGRPVIVTSMSEFEIVDAGTALVPVAMLLWALG